MADSTMNKLKSEIADNPATDRLKEELQNYLRARATNAVSNLGQRLGDGVGKLADGGSGKAGGIASDLAKGGQALSEGKSPAKAAMSMGVSHLKDTVKDKVKGLFGKGGKGKSGGGKSKSVTIVEDIDVGVPVREAYDQWTQFQEFSTFAKGVVSVEKADDTTSNWKVKVAKSTRSWKANVTEQVPDERITWTTEGAKGTVKGVVTFHRITDDLTRVLLVLEYFPKGLFEKTGNIWRAQGRRARLDLKLYRKFIMMRGEASDGWRGEIRDGEVVLEHDDAVEEEERERDEASAAEAEDGEDTQDADLADEDDRAADEYDEDDEPAEDDEPRGEDDSEDEDADLEDEYSDTAEDEELPEDEDLPEDEYDDEDPEDEDPDEPGDEAVQEEERPAPRSRRRRAPAAARS
ncbi:Polyketide cyclase / dehydrase and lipid transport [Streptomyces sp. YIM 130001]|uniref:SRPBCC family protein n=1 Tax=Streptomyces sp. YIM 130001 TaxID=2259644 RepID=UPI000E65E7BD|nr:SRPBCC family protein [Streptomyces sp. YIM 130001]RII20409.1 Polyketide cyclase / dehydrase and lipid transport [Streptomyces sp. YIM 130001]